MVSAIVFLLAVVWLSQPISDTKKGTERGCANTTCVLSPPDTESGKPEEDP